VEADPYLSALIPALNSDATALAQATTAGAVQSAVSSLGNDLDTLGTTLSDEAAYGFSLTILNNNQVGQPQTPTAYAIVIQNNGTQTTTYDLSISGVPSGVTASLSQTSVTLAPGQSTSLSGSATNIAETITSNSTTQLDAFTFTVQVTAEEATEITQTTTGSFAARPAFIQVVSVSPSPAFTDPGGQVDVAAEILNAVNEQQQAEVSYTVTDSGGNVLYTSTPVATTLNVLTTLTSVDLGNLDTTGFALGEDTITVTVADASGSPIPGATGQGTLLIGSPVTASLSTSPTTLPPGSGTITTTLQVNSQISTPPSLSVAGQTAITGGADSVAIYGNYAYVGEPGAIAVVDISNPASPTVVATFGSGQIPGGTNVQVEVNNNELVVLTIAYSFSDQSMLSTYSLTNPLNPTLQGQTSLNYNGVQFVASQVEGMAISNDHVYITSWFFYYYVGGNQIFQQFGEVTDVDISNPASPDVIGVVYNDPPISGEASDEGNSNMWQDAAVNDQTLLVGSTTSTGTNVNGTGVVMVVDTSTPSTPNLLENLQIPGMTLVIGIATYGNDALVIGSSGGWNSGGSPVISFTGNVVLATLDLTNPQDPTIISTQTLDIPSLGLGDLATLGNGQFAAPSLAGTGGAPELLIFNASDPNDVPVSQMSVPNGLDWAVSSGSDFYTTSGSGLVIYNIGPGQPTPVTAEVTIPTDNGVSIVPGSFSVAPSQITNGANSETLEWDLSFTGASTTQTITWQEAVTGLQPGQALPVAQDASVLFTSQGTTATLTLPDQYVTGEQIIGLSPPTQTVAPAAAATYDVTLLNPTSSQVTYDLSTQGVPVGWVNLPSSVTVAANGSADVPLVLTSDSFTPLGDYGFTITANGGNGSLASVEGDLVLQGQPVLPDPESHGIVATLTPTQATAGQGTSAQYVVQLTNTGSADDSFSLAAVGLPTGVTASFGETTIDVPPGASNFRDVTLTLTPGVGTAPGSLPFTVTATSTSLSTVAGSAGGTLIVTAGGVQVTLNPGSGAPGGSFQATVTNTGTTTDTYNLTLAGPAALVSSLAVSQVTLAPGASQVVPISTGAVDFAVQGTLDLTASATSASNPAIQSADSASLAIPATQGMTASFSPATQTLSSPGTATFLLMVQNTGNTEDSYSATIMGTNGPITATLVGLNGSPTQSIPTFILPGLSTGAIELQVDLSAVGQGTVTVQVQSLTNSAETASPDAVTTLSATVIPVVPIKVTPTPTPRSPTSPTDGPKIDVVKRYGYHTMPTTLVLTFNQALDPATAEDVHNYRIVSPEGRRMKIRRAVYDPANQTVTLHLAERISVHHPYKVTVVGTGLEGVSNTQGQFLDGSDSGQPGSDYHLDLTWRELVLGHVSRSFLIEHNIIRTKPRVEAHAEHSGSRTPQPFKRFWSFPSKAMDHKPVEVRASSPSSAANLRRRSAKPYEG
jgi:large repetitive protein